MKILVVQDYLRSGGTERQSCLLSNAFADAGHAVALLTFRPGGPLRDTLKTGVTQITLQPFDFGCDWFAPGLIRTATKWAPDVVLCMGRMANVFGGFLARRLPRAAVVCTMRTGKSLPLAFRRSLRSVRHIIANSNEAEDILKTRYGLPASRITVIHNALVFPPADDLIDNPSLRTSHGAGDQTTVLLWVGMFRPEKNHRECVEIVSRLPPRLDWQLWFGGDGATRSTCEKRAAELGIGGRVKFFGFIRDPVPLYRAADVAVLTSHSESLSNFLIESHAHGLPSVAYAATGVVECGGFVTAIGNSAAFLAQLEKLIADRAYREQESLRMRAFARKAFSPEHQTRAYLELFHRLNLKSAI